MQAMQNAPAVHYGAVHIVEQQTKGEVDDGLVSPRDPTPSAASNFLVVDERDDNIDLPHKG